MSASSTFNDLAAQLEAMLFARRTPDSDKQVARQIAREIAIASLGSRHLWQDLGFSSREEVSAMLQKYFSPLFHLNNHDLKWKKFLYAELGEILGNNTLRPPGCNSCEVSTACFPDSGVLVLIDQ